MRKYIRNIWANPDEHIRVRRGWTSSRRRTVAAKGASVAVLVVIGYLCWIMVQVMAVVLDSMEAALLEVLPCLILIGCCAGALYIVFRKLGVLDRD